MSEQEPPQPSPGSHTGLEESIARLGESITKLENTTLRGAKTAGAACLAAVTVIGLAYLGRQQEPSFASRAAEQYHYSGLDIQTQDSFDQLVYLTPDTIDTVTWTETPRLEREFGEAIQLDLSQISRKLFALDAELPDRPVDEYALAQALIPQDVQAEMRLEDINLVPVAPLHCNVDGFNNYDPLDYSGSLPSDFAVKLTHAGTEDQTLTIPLGGAQTTTAQDPSMIFSTTYNFMKANPVEDLPCWAFPQTIPPNDLKQIY